MHPNENDTSIIYYSGSSPSNKTPTAAKILYVLLGGFVIFNHSTKEQLQILEIAMIGIGILIIAMPFLEETLFRGKFLEFSHNGLRGRLGFGHRINLSWKEVDTLVLEDTGVRISGSENSEWIPINLVEEILPQIKTLAEKHGVRISNIYKTENTE